MTDIKVLSRDVVEIEGTHWYRHNVMCHAEGKNRLAAMMANKILRMMDAYEEPVKKKIVVTHPSRMSAEALEAGAVGEEIEVEEPAFEEEGEGGDGGFRVADMYKKEPAPKWEPGSVVCLCDNRLLILDKLVKVDRSDELWDYTVLDWGSPDDSVPPGRKAKGWIPTNAKVHRLPHEFKVGDWFATENNLVRRVAEDCGDGSIVDEVGVQRLTSEIRHVPPPKEEKPAQERKQALSELAQNEQADGHYRCDLEEKPFTGPHWDVLNQEINEMGIMSIGIAERQKFYDLLRQRDLRDELDRIAGRKQ